MPRRLPIALTALALAFGLAACGSDDEATTTEPANKPAPAATTEAPPATSEGLTISMKDNSFAPAQASVKVGETVTWKNAGQVAHNVNSTDGEKIESDTVAPGGTFEFTPAKAGTIAYVCTFHAGMTGSLTVE